MKLFHILSTVKSLYLIIILDEEVELTDFEKRLNFTKGTVPEFTDVIPKPAFCVKTKHLKES